MSTVFLVSGIAFLIAAFALTVAYWGELSNRRWEAQEQCRASQERPSVQASIGRTLARETVPLLLIMPDGSEEHERAVITLN